MSVIQQAKALVLDYFRALEAARPARLDSVIGQYTGGEYLLRGVHPFNEIIGAEAVAARVWLPLRRAFTGIQRRQEIFMAAPNCLDGAPWVTSMGKFMGLFDQDWLGIPATGRIVLLPYCEFHRVDAGKIAESALFIDVISVMKQAGLTPLPAQTGAEIINPGPRTQDGLLFDAQDEAESRNTLELIRTMCDDLVNKDGFQSPAASLANTWHEDMLWWGPAGIGATYTIPRYQAQHQGPFRAGLENIEFKGHVLEHAEGNYGGWFGWPNMTLEQGRGFLGLPASSQTTEMRVVDMYRREGNKLAENWVFIDFPHYLLLLGVDVLGRGAAIARPTT